MTIYDHKRAWFEENTRIIWGNSELERPLLDGGALNDNSLRIKRELERISREGQLVTQVSQPNSAKSVEIKVSKWATPEFKIKPKNWGNW